MLRFVVRRLLLLIPILLGVSLLVFFWIRGLPGGPAAALLGERATAEDVAAIEHQYGLDQPIYVQYGKYVKQLATLNFGASSTSRQPVTTEFRQRFPATIELACPVANAGFMTITLLSNSTAARTWSASCPRTTITPSAREAMALSITC